ncbi:MAG: hypothetical protein ACRDL2_05965 [Gaiellaceae bacterium]
MGRATLIAVVSLLAAAPAADARGVALRGAVAKTSHVSSLRYVIDIAVLRRRYPASILHVSGARGPGALYVHVKSLAEVLADGTQIPGPSQSAMVDGPFLYEGAPNGIAINGGIRWLRVPLGRAARALDAMRHLGPTPLFHVLQESLPARAQGRTVKGTVAYDDPVVRTALVGMTGGIEFRSLRFEATVGADGYVHAVKMTGRTADGSRSLRVSVRLYAFGRPVRLTPPAEGTFMDRKSFLLAD